MGEEINKCVLCGFCKANCPVFKILLTEANSPRGKAIMIKKEVIDSIFYKCTLCGACNAECPIGVDLESEMVKMRQKLVERGIETEDNKKMIEKIRAEGIPFGRIEKGKTPKNLYCC